MNRDKRLRAWLEEQGHGIVIRAAEEWMEFCDASRHPVSLTAAVEVVDPITFRMWREIDND